MLLSSTLRKKKTLARLACLCFHQRTFFHFNMLRPSYSSILSSNYSLKLNLGNTLKVKLNMKIKLRKRIDGMQRSVLLSWSTRLHVDLFDLFSFQLKFQLIGVGRFQFEHICLNSDWPKKRRIKVTVYLQGCLARKRCSACSLSCRYLNPYIKLKLMELAIKLYQQFWKKMNCRIFHDH